MNLVAMSSTTDTTKPEDTEHVQIFETIFNLFATSVKLIGIRSAYRWNPWKNAVFWFIIFLDVYAWSCIFYTQSLHIKSGEIVRVLEIFAIYGIVSSVFMDMVKFVKTKLNF